MRFFIEVDKEENLFTNEKILNSFLQARDCYISAIPSSDKIKFNLKGCLINGIYTEGGKTKLEFVVDLID